MKLWTYFSVGRLNKVCGDNLLPDYWRGCFTSRFLVEDVLDNFTDRMASSDVSRLPVKLKNDLGSYHPVVTKKNRLT